MKREISQAQKAERNEIWKRVGTAALGGGISVGSFLLFFAFSHGISTVLICAVDIGYAFWHACGEFKEKKWDGTKRFLIPLLMVIFWALVFCVLCVGNASVLEKDFSYQLFLYPIFLMPAYEIVFLLFCLVASGL